MIIIRIFVAFFRTIGELFMKFVRLHKKIYDPRNLFHYDNVLALGSIYLFLQLLSTLNFEILNPVGDAFDDVAINDVVFSGMGKNAHLREVTDDDGDVKPLTDTNIVLVNCGDLSRQEVGSLVWRLSFYKPKVVALDMLFGPDADPAFQGAENQEAAMKSTLILSDALDLCENVVIGRRGLMKSDSTEFEGEYDILERGTPIVYSEGRHQALVNLYVDDPDGLAVCRKFQTGARILDDSIEMDHFTAKILKLYSPEHYKKFNERGNLWEYVNYTGNIYPPEAISNLTIQWRMEGWPQKRIEEELQTMYPFRRFLAYDYSYFMYNSESYYQDTAPSPTIDYLKERLEGKIVIIGYLNKHISHLDRVDEDSYFTPLNPKYVGKAKKDMYGVVIHANILSMMLRNHYIDVMPDWLGHLIGLIVTYLVFASFRPIYNDYKNWYDGLTKFLGIILSIVLLAIIGIVFDYWDYEINFSAFYFGCILLAGDWLEVYYGFIKNFIKRVKNNM